MSEYDNKNQDRKPAFIAYSVRDSQDGKGHWNRIGAAWEHRDGQGYEISLDSLPINGRVTLRQLREERMQDYESARGAREPRHHAERTQSRGRQR